MIEYIQSLDLEPFAPYIYLEMAILVGIGLYGHLQRQRSYQIVRSFGFSNYKRDIGRIERELNSLLPKTWAIFLAKAGTKRAR